VVATDIFLSHIDELLMLHRSNPYLKLYVVVSLFCLDNIKMDLVQIG
jgi:hypothetical protein